STGLQSFIVVIVSMSILLYLQWSMALLIIAGAALIVVGPLLLNKRTAEIYQQYKEQAAALNSDVTENVKAQKLIKSYSLQQVMQARFEQRLKQLFVSSYSLNIINAALGRVPMVSLLFVNLVIMLYGSYLALTDHITIGELVAFYTMYMSMGNSVFNLTFIIPSITNAKVSIERIQQAMGQAEEGLLLEAGQTEPMEQMSIKLEGVSFGYEQERYVLQDINLNIPSGSNVAFVGSSGSGKSSMIQLILGLYQPSEGRIDVNNAPLIAGKLAAYRQQLAVVFQDNFMFTGTIRENIALSNPEASEEEIIAAAKLAEIHDYIVSLPEGYNTKV